MQNYAIGISGLNAAQAALDIIGNNIANAATDGYHRQRLELAPSSYGQTAAETTGAGVDVAGVTRMIDGLLEREITRQESAYGQVSQELSTLSSVETMLGEFSEGSGLNATIDAFFDSLRGLAAHPLEQVWRNETVNAAEALANEFRRLGSSLEGLEDQLVLEAQNTASAVNALITQIAELNANIQAAEVNRGQANNLRDHRDHLITELASLVGIETQQREYGVVDVSIAGLPVVAGSLATGLEAKLGEGEVLGIFAAGAGGRSLEIEGGRLGGLLTLKNDLLGGLHADLDTLARTIVEQVNRNHVQGLGQEGSFTQLTGWPMGDGDLAANGSASDGTFYVRLTNTTTGAVQRHAIDVNVSGPTPDTLTSIAAKLEALVGLEASVVSSRLYMAADSGYTFDFLPAVSPAPTATNFTAATPPPVTVSGLYNADGNHTFRFTVAGSGSVGNGSLRLNVTDESGNAVDTLEVGAGYAGGDVIELSNGIRISVGLGELNDGDSFDVEAFATSDTSGLLAAAGMNTFFAGTSALDMRVCREIVEAPDRIATALGGELKDNTAALRLAAVREQAVGALSGMTPSEYYHRTVASLSQQVALKQSRQENIQAVMQNLEKQRSDISSVNINDEAAQLLVFEKMFQAMAKYLSGLQTTMTTLMNMV
jgi:flagellar hook-associated protein 1 FlgK